MAKAEAALSKIANGTRQYEPDVIERVVGKTLVDREGLIRKLQKLQRLVELTIVDVQSGDIESIPENRLSTVVYDIEEEISNYQKVADILTVLAEAF